MSMKRGITGKPCVYRPEKEYRCEQCKSLVAMDVHTDLEGYTIFCSRTCYDTWLIKNIKVYIGRRVK